MKYYKVNYSKEALDDLKSIYSYIAEELQVPDIALKQVNRIRKQIRLLDTMPTRHGKVEWEPWHTLGIHQLPIDNFIIYYLVDIDKNFVSIIRIFYSGQDIKCIVNTETKH